MSSHKSLFEARCVALAGENPDGCRLHFSCRAKRRGKIINTRQFAKRCDVRLKRVFARIGLVVKPVDPFVTAEERDFMLPSGEIQKLYVCDYYVTISVGRYWWLAWRLWRRLCGRA